MSEFKRTVRDENGAVVPLADIYVRDETNSSLVTIYSDSAMTSAITQPATSGSDGEFTFYVPPGTYTVTAERGGDTFVKKDRVLAEKIYAGGPEVIASDEFARGENAYWMTEDGIIYKEAAPGATDQHITTSGSSVKLYVSGEVWKGEALGIVADDDGTGTTGTDNATALARLKTAITNKSQAGERVRVIMPKGFIRSSVEFDLSDTLGESVYIDGHETQIVFTHATPAANRRYFSIRNTSGTNIPEISVRGLSVILNRDASGKALGGSDMISVGGADTMTVDDCRVPRADNMAITVNRSITSIPKFIRVSGCYVGFGSTVSAKNYGAVDDTGIWITNYGRHVEVTGNFVESCGDDGIAVVNTSNAALAATAIIIGNSVKNVGASGIKSAAIRSTITSNEVHNTRNAAIRLLDLGTGSAAGVIFPQYGMIANNTVTNAGQATAANLNVTNVISQGTPYGCMFAEASGGVKVFNNHFVNSYADAVSFYASTRNISGVEIHGNVFDGCADSGTAVIRVAGASATLTATDLIVRNNTFRDITTRLFTWTCALPNRDNGTDGNMRWMDNIIQDSDFSGTDSIYTIGGSGSANVTDLTIEGDKFFNCTLASATSVDIGNMSRFDISCSYFWDRAEFVFPLQDYYIANSNSAAVRGKYPTITATRLVNASGGHEILRLDAAISYHIEAWADDPDNDAYGAVLSARWAGNARGSGTPANGISMPIQTTSADASQVLQITLDSATPQFASGTDLVVGGVATWSPGAEVVVSATGYTTEKHFAKIT